LNISELPFVFKHIGVMPDCHLGKGATVGSVIANEGCHHAGPQSVFISAVA
jgi:RNA-splicing ligase RtcB